MPDFDLAALQHGSEVPDYRLSDARMRFRLSYTPASGGTPTELAIREPLQWDGAEWVIARDPDYHGFTFEYTGDEAQLTFREKRAVDFITNAYNNDGPDASITLIWELEYFGDVLPGQSLLLLLAKRTMSGGVLSVPGQRAGVHNDLRSKWNTAIALNAVKTLEGSDLTPPNPVQLLLHAQTVAQQTKWSTKDKQDTGWQTIANIGSADYKVFYLSFPLENPVLDEIISEGSGKGSTAGIGTEYPPEILRHILKPRDPGVYVFDLEALDFVFDLTMQKRSISINPPDIDDWTLDVFLIIGSEKIRIGIEQTGHKDSRFLDGVRFIGKNTVTRTLTADTPVYLFAAFQIYPKRSSWKGTEVRLVTNKCILTVKAATTANASIVPGYLTIDVLRHLFAALTGRPDSVQSAYYSLRSEIQPADGGGARRLQFNGFAARGFNPPSGTTKPMQLSLENQIQSLNAIDSIGFAIKPEVGGDVLVVEPAAFFYRYTEVLALTSYTVTDEETEARVLFGKIQVGYSKFPDEGPQVLDEFATKHDYNTPLRSENTYTAVSDLIASGYALEQTRREQFSEKPADSTKYDDDCFIVCSLPPTELSHTALIGGSFGYAGILGAVMTINGLVPEWLVVGVDFTVSGSQYNNKTFRVKKLTASKPGVSIGGIVGRTTVSISTTSLIVPESGFFTLTASGDSGALWQAERDEAFALIQNVTDPGTTYNLRLSPRFNLLRHAPVLAGGLVYKDAGKLLTLQFAKQNAGLVTQLLEAAEGESNINVRKRIQHNDPLPVADLRGPIPPLWRPEVVTVSTKLTIDQMLYLRACFQGTHPDPTKHLGYITLVGNEAAGIPTINGWPLKISFNVAKGEATIRLRKLYIPKGGSVPGDGCEFYANFTFGDFENLPPGTLPPWIEDCIFGIFS